MAGVWLARLIIGVRCEPSPAHEVHWSTPAVLIAGHVDRHGVRGRDRRRCPAVARKNSGVLLASGAVRVDGEDPARGVEVAALQAVAVEERALQVVAARGGAEEPVAHQVAGADLELEASSTRTDPRGAGDQQRRQVSSRRRPRPSAVLTHCAATYWKPVWRRQPLLFVQLGRAPRTSRPLLIAPAPRRRGGRGDRTRRRVSARPRIRRGGRRGSRGVRRPPVAAGIVARVVGRSPRPRRPSSPRRRSADPRGSRRGRRVASSAAAGGGGRGHWSGRPGRRRAPAGPCSCRRCGPRG